MTTAVERIQPRGVNRRESVHRNVDQSADIQDSAFAIQPLDDDRKATGLQETRQGISAKGVLIWAMGFATPAKADKPLAAASFFERLAAAHG